MLETRCSRKSSGTREKCGGFKKLKRSVSLEARLGGNKMESWKGNRSRKSMWDINTFVFCSKYNEIFMIFF